MQQFEAVLTTAGLNSVTPEFSSLDTDLQRVDYVLNHHPSIREFSPCPTPDRKSDCRAANLRSQGNKCLERRDFRAGLLMYTRAIFAAESGLERALCHGNRSMVLWELEFFQDCLVEIERSIECGFPVDRIFRLHTRAGECFLALGRFCEARERLITALSSLTSNKNEAWRLRIVNSLDKCFKDERSSKRRGRVLHCDRPNPTSVEENNKNLDLPAASGALELVETDEAGRGIVTTRDVKIGEILLIERPYCSRLVAECFNTYCYTCHVRCITLLPCRSCDQVGFCSVLCEQNAWIPSEPSSKDFPPSGNCSIGHQWECAVMRHYLHSPVSSLAPLAYASVARTTLAEVCRVLSGEHPTLRPYTSWDYAAAVSIVGNSDSRNAQDLLSRTLLAVFMMTCLKSVGYFSKRADNEKEGSCPIESDQTDEALVAVALLRHLQSLPCNAHDVAEQVISPLDGSCPERKELSSALYPTLSLINHSCSPNVVRISFVNDMCQLRAIAPLPKGSQLLDNYSAHYALLTREERRSTLTSQYFFQCACVPCLEDWPTFARMMQMQDEPRYCCPHCKNPLPSSRPLSCPQCPSQTAIIDNLSTQLNHYRSIFPEQMALVAAGQCSPAIEQDAVSYLGCLHQLVQQPYYEFDQALETLKMIWNLAGNSFHDFE